MKHSSYGRLHPRKRGPNRSMRVITCIVCEKAFESSRAATKICSVECKTKRMIEYRRSYKNIDRNRTCIVCGGGFVLGGSGSRSKICSPECYTFRRNHNPRYKPAPLRFITCLVCETVFQGKGKRATCSEACQKARPASYYIEHNPLSPKPCIICNETFYTSARTHKNTCSPTCSKFSLLQARHEYREANRARRRAYDRDKNAHAYAAVNVCRSMGINIPWEEAKLALKILKEELPTLTI